ncbi:SDR family NAD(P)-dependent oxidoreductase [Modestobacter sp. VKM Ac-2986]|uniref:SDR family NAD(P)-dependent oxidoreductase n=1 Tax=Modestobacter sp. VKM Ac-2986 TaxID=3004140 RepID=UPI0022ABBE8A|nr:SDR family NAD(P)-dependent oxidoreductase [Modestobacter sp. VKM Ac-2986]MCZ2830700.1 SDR family NAD(P)-dependent oxidoreductase [Modestobacter sp. VKM Ac-2986]
MTQNVTEPQIKPLALVTGASSGIGFELAKQFAEHGYDVVVNAEDAGIQKAAMLIQASGAQVVPVQADLRTEQGVAQLWEAVQALGRPLEAAALNAGVGQSGAFVDTDWADDLSIMQLNIVSTAALLKLALVEMTARNSGRILVTSSIASTMPGAYQPVYNASKSFVQSLTEAVQAELADKDSAVTVTSLMPGPVDTDFFDRAGLEDTSMGQGPKDGADAVAAQGFEALMGGERKVVAASLATKAQAAAAGVLPDSVKAAVHKVMAKPQD